MVIIKRDQITTRPSDKLLIPLIGKMKIARQIGYSYKLEIPLGIQWRGIKIFHTDRLRRHCNNPLPGQEPPRPGLVANENNNNDNNDP